jgi:hypothetical protein
MTQNDIIALINEIQTAADYPATKMNPLLNNILSAAYGPMYIGAIPPGNTNDETAGYRPGSVGYDTITERFYICETALSGNASWVLIPADAKFASLNYKSPNITVGTDVNVSIVKVTNNNLVLNTGCSVKLPANPFIGKTVLVYFVDSINVFTVRDSSGTAIVGAGSLTIPAAQQYSFSYSGTAWEIVGVNNSTAGTPSGVDVSNLAGVVVNDTNKLTFLGTSVTVLSDGSGGAEVTINPLAGIDVTRGATTITSAQEITFTNNFAVTGGAGIANVAYVSKIGIEQDGTSLTNPASTIDGFDFKGSMFSGVPIALNGNTAEVTLNGAKVLTLSGDLMPTASNDSSQGYSLGSIGRNTGSLQRTYICRNNNVGAAVWDLITEDRDFQQIAPIVNNGIGQINNSISSVQLIGSSISISVYTLKAPLYAYLGKKIHIFSLTNITNFYFKNAAGNVTYFLANVVSGKGIVAVCTDEALQTWVQIG